MKKEYIIGGCIGLIFVIAIIACIIVGLFNKKGSNYIPTVAKIVSLDENGDVIDKFCVYESKGLGFVLFKSESDAIKAKETLNEKNYQYLGHNLKLIIEDYDYNKGEKKHFQNLSHNMGYDGGNSFRGGRGKRQVYRL